VTLALALTRRAAICGISAALLAGPAGHGQTRPARRPLGLADITVRKEIVADYAGTLKKVAAMGYSHFGFRLSDYLPDSSEPAAADKAKMVRDSGLQVGVVRLNPVGKDPDREIEQAAAIGGTIIALTAAPVFIAGDHLGTSTRADFDAWLPTLVELDNKCSKAGLTLAYHNHWWDHRMLNGETPWEIVAKRTNVAFELDCAWAWIGGIAPLELARNYSDRIVSMHFKDVDPTRGRNLFEQLVAPGEGQLDYAALLPNLDLVTDAIGYVEVDAPEDGLASAARAGRFLSAVRSKWHG
jgi:sugar phosphate isomerase/epimerase